MMKPKYISNGKMIVPGLFIETCGDNTNLVEFTLGEYDKELNGKVLKSLHQIFLSYNDPTGYEFAIQFLGSYEHFQRMLTHHTVGSYIQKWIEEIKVRIDSQTIKKIETIAADGGSQTQLSAAKYLLAREYESKGNVGRPSNKKSDIKNRKEAEDMSMATKKEMERLGLTH